MEYSTNNLSAIDKSKWEHEFQFDSGSIESTCFRCGVGFSQISTFKCTRNKIPRSIRSVFVADELLKEDKMEDLYLLF